MVDVAASSRRNRRVVSSLPGELLLGAAAKRVYAAALAQGRNQERVPSLAELAPLAERGLQMTVAEQAQFSNTYNTLTHLFGMTSHAIELLLLTLAMELDERVYAAVMNLTASPLGAGGPRVGGVLSLLYPDLEQRALALRALLDDAPLCSFRLVRLLSTMKNAPVSQRELCAEPSLLGHLLGGAEPPPLPPQLASSGLLSGPADLDPLDGELPTDLVYRLELLLAAPGTVRGLHMALTSVRNAPSIARRIAARLDRPIILLDLRAVGDEHAEKVAIALREARLRHGIALFVNPMALSDDESSGAVVRRHAQQWRRMLALESKPVLFASEDPETPDVDLLPSVGLDITTYTFPASTLAQRRDLFETALGQVYREQPGGIPQISLDEEVSFEQLANVYRIEQAEVRSIVNQAVAEARVRALVDETIPVITMPDLRAAARSKTHRDVGKFARLIESHYGWDDLVLASDVRAMLSEIRASARHRMQVHETWGYADKHKRGLSLCMVFAGEPGTGKTMSAEVLANDLGVNMYQVDISAVVSKWIGETERHLAQIFNATEGSDSILFFDEADALFGKRTEVNESKDRYANIEVSYLLQRIEQYNGIVILSTNQQTNMDEAFLRRLQFGVEFPMPEEAERRELWRRAFPARAPLHNVDLDVLAAKYDELSGGQIKLIALGAALLAAGEDTFVSMATIHRAYVNECIKMRRVLQEKKVAAHTIVPPVQRIVLNLNQD